MYIYECLTITTIMITKRHTIQGKVCDIPKYVSNCLVLEEAVDYQDTFIWCQHFLLK